MKNRNWIIAGVIVLLIAIGVGIYFYMKRKQDPYAPLVSENGSLGTPSPVPEDNRDRR